MGLYSEWIFPRLLDWGMKHRVLSEHRRDLLTEAEGEVLEIGFGTGLNLSFYPRDIKSLTAVEPSPGMLELARKRCSKPPFELRLELLAAERLDFPDRSFDTAVATWTLCSVADAGQTIRAVRRTLRPGGKFLFVEHGLSPDRRIQVWQHRLNPLQKRVGAGCNLNRDVPTLLRSNGFEIARLEEFCLEKTPRLWGWTFKGVARRK